MSKMRVGRVSSLVIELEDLVRLLYINRCEKVVCLISRSLVMGKVVQR